MTDTYNRLTKNHEKLFVMSGGTYAESFQEPLHAEQVCRCPLAPGTFPKGHGDYHQPDEAISLKRVEMALVIYIKGILEICRKSNIMIAESKRSEIRYKRIFDLLTCQKHKNPTALGKR